jgi:hypothetical protein
MIAPRSVYESPTLMCAGLLPLIEITGGLQGRMGFRRSCRMRGRGQTSDLQAECRLGRASDLQRLRLRIGLTGRQAGFRVCRLPRGI